MLVRLIRLFLEIGNKNCGIYRWRLLNINYYLETILYSISSSQRTYYSKYTKCGLIIISAWLVSIPLLTVCNYLLVKVYLRYLWRLYRNIVYIMDKAVSNTGHDYICSFLYTVYLIFNTFL